MQELWRFFKSVKVAIKDSTLVNQELEIEIRLRELLKYYYEHFSLSKEYKKYDKKSRELISKSMSDLSQILSM